MLEFIGVPLDRIRCLEHDVSGNFKRKSYLPKQAFALKKKHDWIHALLTEKDREILSNRRQVLESRTGGILPEYYSFF